MKTAPKKGARRSSGAAAGKPVTRSVSSFEEHEHELAVSVEISPVDDMFVEGHLDHYMESGRSAIRCIRIAMLAANKESISSCLDLPCGYGRSLRYLKAAFPDASFTACDIQREGVEFCASTFGATPVHAAPDPADISIDETFDLIWCGSLLSHMDSQRFLGFLELFHRLLAPGGVLVFTTQGRRHFEILLDRSGQHSQALGEVKTERLISDYRLNGFGYVDYENQERYGTTLASRAWIMEQLDRLPDLRLVGFVEHGWHDHQDVIACVRTADR